MALKVMTKKGYVEGIEDKGLHKYLGIPYAKPPVEELRFKRAREMEAWDNIYPAHTYGPIAAQFHMDEYQGSLDCLSLNIVKPATGDLLPVFVWIHGGGYMTGSGSDPLYHGEAFARNGIVYVNFQYRLNVFGVFDFTTYKGCEDFESNCGLSDMVLALQWVKENIEAFGGDPNAITIGGESAGGSAVLTLMAVPEVKGCFNQVISESALPNCVMTKSLSRINTDLYLEGMGWSEEDLDQLRTADPYDLIKGLDYVNSRFQYENPGIFLPCPVIDDLLPQRPMEAIEEGKAEGIRLLIGSNLHEGTMFVRPENTVFPNSWDMIETMFEDNDYKDRFKSVKAYYDKPDFLDKYGSPFVHFATDYAFEVPAVKIAGDQSQVGPVWMYRYEFISASSRQNGMMASHAFELPCVFGVAEHPFSKMLFGQESEDIQTKMIEMFQRPWVNFIKGDSPDGESWPQYKGCDSPVKIFDRQERLESLNHKEMLEVWKDLHFFEN